MKKFLLIVAMCFVFTSVAMSKEVEDPVEKTVDPEVKKEQAEEKKEKAEEVVQEAKQEEKEAVAEEKAADGEDEEPKTEQEVEASASGEADAEPKQEEEKKDDTEEEARPRPMSPAKDYPANQNLPPASRPKYRCELCMMVIGRKLQNQNLCNGLEHKADIETCREMVETLTLYDRYVVDWLYGDGCQRTTKGGWNNVKPCPSHVICSWMIRQFNDGQRRTFCQFEDPMYRRSPAFHAKHHIATQEVEEEGKGEEEKKESEVVKDDDAEVKTEDKTL